MTLKGARIRFIEKPFDDMDGDFVVRTQCESTPPRQCGMEIYRPDGEWFGFFYFSMKKCSSPTFVMERNGVATMYPFSRFE